MIFMADIPEKVIDAGILLGDNYADVILKLASQRVNQRINTPNSFLHDIIVPVIDVSSVEVLDPLSLPSPALVRQLPRQVMRDDLGEEDDSYSL